MALAAEQWLAEHVPAERATVLRLAGIYGPGRIPLLAKLREREPLPVAEGDLNLIHVVDAAEAIVQLLERPAPPRLYVLSDGHPVARRTFYEDAARIFGTPEPVFVAPEPGSARAGRGESNKRIRPQRIMADLGLVLRYPDHLAGFTAIAASERGR
jgi:nucleoside-diphosphate-sugar epimerase